MGCAGFQVFQCSGGEGPAENLLQEDKKAKKKEKGEERK